MSPERIQAAVEGLARRAGEAEAAKDGSLCGVPLVEVQVEGQRLRFAFDFMILFTTISGSDWYHHHVFTGTATIGAERLTDVSTVERLDERVTEHEYEWAEPPYDRRAVLRALAREAWAG